MLSLEDSLAYALATSNLAGSEAGNYTSRHSINTERIVYTADNVEIVSVHGES